MCRLPIVLAVLAAGCSQAPRRISTPVPDARGFALRSQTADQQVAHALSRLTFGARPGDPQLVRDMGVDRWIDEQLHPSALTIRTRTRGSASSRW